MPHIPSLHAILLGKLVLRRIKDYPKQRIIAFKSMRTETIAIDASGAISAQYSNGGLLIESL